MINRFLIVNADDCNLTPGVTKAILDCHDQGILTSTTFMVNLPVTSQTVKAVLSRKNLGVGIHLNVTLGNPVSASLEIPSLLGENGKFKKLGEQMARLPKASELAFEYQKQINRFRKILGRNPTHLDTHHQVHDAPFFYEVLKRVAHENQVPLRRSMMMRDPAKRKGVRTTDYFFGNLTIEGFWREQPLKTVLSHLPSGTSEIMCHPGIHDRDLESISSFTEGRVMEYRLFRSPAMRRLTSSLGIVLTHFGHVL